MKTSKNENGYVLLMVLMLVLLFTVLGMALMTTNINSAKQFTLKENQVQARHQAEMGVLHYERILKEKINRNSNSALSCSDIDSLLKPSNKLVFGKYVIEPGITGSSSCNTVDADKLKITITSTGVINSVTEKEVKATFNVVNKGGSLTSKPIGPPAKPTGPNTQIEKKILKKQDTTIFPDDVIVQEKLELDPGFQNILKFSKDLYIEGDLSLTTQGCIATGGNFTALKNFVWGDAKTNILVRKNAFLPSEVTRWKSSTGNESYRKDRVESTEMFVFGDLYLPGIHNYSLLEVQQGKVVEVYNVDNKLNLFVAGNVYKYNGTEYVKITNPFKPITLEDMEKKASFLSCNIAEFVDPPQWTLMDEKIVDYN